MRILVADHISEEALEKLRELGEVVFKPEISREELLNEIRKAEVLVVRSRTKVDREVISRGERLKVIARPGVGLDNIDLEAAKERGIKVLNTPGAVTEAVAELVFAHLLSLLRRIPEANESLRRGEWIKKDLIGEELYGKTMGIVGFGRIGSRVAEISRAFGMKVLVFDPYVKAEGFEQVDSLDELVRRSDFVSIHVPLTEETKGLFKEGVLKNMKEGAVLINTSRGGVVEQKALFKFLKSGRIRACLDVFEREPPGEDALFSIGTEKLSVSPHIGASTIESQRRAGLELVDRIKEAIGLG